MFIPHTCLIYLLIYSTFSWSLEIPKGLSKSDRQEVVRLLGLNAAPKILSNPYSLGGYQGFEIGASVEFINVRDLERLGCTPGTSGCANTQKANDRELRYTRLTFGKGLYHDVDMFMHLVPPTSGSRISDYGAQLRWSFYQAKFLPINVALLFYGNQMNIEDDFINQNLGLELISGVSVDNFSIYLGLGQIYARGQFMGGTVGNGTVTSGDSDINGESNTVTERVHANHVVVGLSIHYENLFLAAQIDRYRDPVYGAKLGLRY